MPIIRIRVQWTGNGKMYYYSSITEALTQFTRQELNESWIDLIEDGEVMARIIL